MYRFLCTFIFIGATLFSQSNSRSPNWFKGDHFVIYNTCKTAILFCESTQQDYTFCGATKNCQGLYVMPGDTFLLNYEDKLQSMSIVAGISFQNYLPAVSGHTFLPVTNCIPPQPLLIAIPLNAVSGSSFQVNAQNPVYSPPETFQPWVPLPIYVYVGGPQPANTSALSGFSTCPAADTSATGVSVKELSDQDKFIIYPNPSAGSITIKCKVPYEDKLTMRIIDLLGKEILNEIYKEESDISHLEKGIYFLSLYQNGSLLATKKLIKE
jgi:hypothetical protein